MENITTTNATKPNGQSFEELYRGKQFKAAIDLLLSQKDQFKPAIFHYNLGTCYAKLEEWGAARFNFEKAKSLGFSHSMLNNNLNVVLQKIDTIELANSVSLFDRTIVWGLSTSRDLFLAVELTLFLSILLALKFMKKQSKALLGFLSLFMILTSLFYFVPRTYNVAIILEDSQTLEGPSNLFAPKFLVKKGARVILEKEAKENWFLIKYPEQLSGWVHKKSLGFY